MYAKSIESLLREITSNPQLHCHAKLKNGKIYGSIWMGFAQHRFILNLSDGGRLVAVGPVVREPVKESQRVYLERCAEQIPETDSLLKEGDTWWFVATASHHELMRLMYRLRSFLSKSSEALHLLEQPAMAQQYLALSGRRVRGKNLSFQEHRRR